MKYSLRSLMIGMTLFCVVLGARIAYLRRWAAFYEDKAIRMQARYDEFTGEETFDDQVAVVFEREKCILLHSRYLDASFRPWTIVNDSVNEDELDQ